MSNPLEMESDVIHVDEGDDPFKGQMRFHQSWYRKHELRLESGPNPHAMDKNALYGNRLQPKDGATGYNFLSDEAFRIARERFGQGHSVSKKFARSRLLTDLLSSQPMRFNLFPPLVEDRALATRLIQSLPGVPAGITVTRVALEYAPDDKARHLDDGTSHDAFVEYELPNGDLGLIGIETKLTEPFGPDSYPFDKRYSRWMKAPGWWWRDGSESEFPNKKFNQLWRNHLLAFAMLKQEPPQYVQAHAAVLYHDDDASCPDAMQAYRSLLRPEAQDTLLDWPLSMVLETWENLLETAEQKSWFADFRLRYWTLDASKKAWVAYRTSRGK